MKCLLTLDTGKNTGWAIRTREGKILSGKAMFPTHSGDTWGWIFRRYRAWLIRLLNEHNPSMIAYETPHHRGGPSTRALVGFVSHLQEVFCTRRIYSIHTLTLKKYVTGYGRAEKEEMMEAVGKRFPHFRKKLRANDELEEKLDDESDALATLQWLMGEIEGKPTIRVRKS